MALLLLIILTATELGFTVFGFTAKDTKKEWTLKRVIVTAAQIIIYLLMLVLPGIDAGFRFKGLIVCLFIRLAAAGIFWICNRRDQKIKKKGAMAAGAVLSIILIASSMAPAFLFSDYNGRPLTGEYNVLQAQTILIDRSRIEEFETDGSFREVPVHFFYPEGCEEKLPLIIFSHGAFGYYQSNESTFMELASNGYVVASIEHPYHSLFTKDTNGRLITVDPGFFNDALTIGNSDDEYTEEEIFAYTSVWMKIRLDDMNFAIDTLKEASENGITDVFFEPDRNVIDAVSLIDDSRIGLIGHSMGGATAVTCGRRDDISAVVDLDGTMLGEILGAAGNEDIINTEPYTTPLLNFEKEDHHEGRTEYEREGITYVNSVILGGAEEAFNTYFTGAEHMDFTDLPLFSPVLAGSLGSGDVDHEAMIDTVNGIVVRFFDCYLKGEGTFTVNECY
ncbi:MAG: hypothetical protein J5685_07115 [Clostridiales bacterium]|nr:hypothetical protein [Clostridiales bacterium]